MTSQTFRLSESRANLFALAIFFLMAVSMNIHAQEPSMKALVGQSLSKIEQSSPESFLNCIAELKRIDAMFPDSIQPKYVMALQSLNYSVMNPHAVQTENLLAEAEQTISVMEKMKNADQSDICTLRGFLYMVRIVQNPEKNGQRYYLDVMQNYEKALKLNPENQLAQQLQTKFLEGMQQARGGQ